MGFHREPCWGQFYLQCISTAFFADDTVITYTAKNWNELRNIAEEDLKTVKSWFDEMYLTINFEKTKFIPFSYNKANIPVYSTLRISIEN